MGNKAGNSLVSDLRSELNKAAKENIAYDLHGDNPTDVKTWISTGSTLLDYIISNRRDGGSLSASSPRLLVSLLAARVLSSLRS